MIHGKICACLESKLPRNPRKSVQVQYTDNIERFSTTIEAYQAIAELPQEYVAQRLAAFGLRPFEVELLVARFWEGLSFSEIVKTQGWTSVGSASHCFRQVLKKLRTSGFHV